jgi:hypothetical protein
VDVAPIELDIEALGAPEEVNFAAGRFERDPRVDLGLRQARRPAQRERALLEL